MASAKSPADQWYFFKSKSDIVEYFNPDCAGRDVLVIAVS